MKIYSSSDIWSLVSTKETKILARMLAKKSYCGKLLLIFPAENLFFFFFFGTLIFGRHSHPLRIAFWLSKDLA